MQQDFFVRENFDGIILHFCTEFAVGNFAPSCCESAFGKARLAMLKRFFGLFQVVFQGIWLEMLIFLNAILAFLLSGGLLLIACGS